MIRSVFSEQLVQLGAAAPTWAARRLKERLGPIRRLRHLLVERAGELTDVLVEEIGKSPEEALSGDLLPLAAHCKFLEGRAAALLAPRRFGALGRPAFLWGYRHAVHRRPWGLVGIIGTWNYPMFLNGVQITSALVAGNVVLWKPSELAAHCADAMLRLFADAGFPPGVVESAGCERTAGADLLEAPLDHLVFTGAAATGRKIAERLGQRLIPSTLELSGCDALMALPDADAQRVADAAWFGMTYNRGQTCVAVRRILAPGATHDRIVDGLREHLATMGAVRLRTVRQCEAAEELLAQAVGAGAKIVRAPASNSDPPEFAPAIVLNAKPEMDVCRADFFAPVLAVLRYDCVEDLARLNAACPFGLETKIMSNDVAAAEALARTLPVGSVSINDVLTATADPRIALGGRGQSGWGVSQGEEGLLAMTAPQTVSIRGGAFRPHLTRPGQPAKLSAAALQGMLAGMYGGSMGTKLRGWLAAARGMMA